MQMGTHHVLVVAFVEIPAVLCRHGLHLVLVCVLVTCFTDAWTKHEVRFVTQVSVRGEEASVVSVHSLCSELLSAHHLTL